MYRRGKRKKKVRPQGSPLSRMGFRSVEDFKKQNQQSTEKKRQSEEIEFDEHGVKGVYDDNLNIHKLHRIIVEKLSEIDEAEIEALEKQKKELYQKIEDNAHDLVYNDLLDLAKKIESCEKRINDIREQTMLKEYLSFAEGILEQYDQLVSQQGGQKKKVSDLIDQYIRFANNDLFNISLIKKVDRKEGVCGFCKTNLDQAENENGYLICTVCGAVAREIISSYQQGSRSEGGEYENTKNESAENVKNFRKAILNFDHRADTSHLPSDSQIVEKLDQWFASNEPKLHRDYVQNNGFDRWIRKGTSVADMETAMRANGFNKWYDNIYHFCKVYWGWQRPRISHLEESLVDDFLKSRASYNAHKGNRSSSMNVNYELYHGLLRHGFECKFTDFKMVSTRSTLNEYDEIRKKVEADMGWSK